MGAQISGSGPVTTADQSHRQAITGRDPGRGNRTVILWRETDLVNGRVQRQVMITLDATPRTAVILTLPQAAELADALRAAAASRASCDQQDRPEAAIGFGQVCLRETMSRSCNGCLEEGAVDAPSRGVALLRAGVGAVLTAFPDRVASAAEGRPAAPLARRLMRVLGVRQLVQATVSVTVPAVLSPARGAVIDALHGATMLLAALRPRHRRAALINAALAAAFCGLGAARAHKQYAHEQQGDAIRTGPPARQEVSPMATHRAEFVLRDRRRELPADSEQFSLGLESDRNLDWAKLIAGVISAAFLIGMLITSLFRAPNVEWTVLLALVATGLGMAMIVEMARRRVRTDS